MKILYEEYTFDAGAKTITFNSLDSISLEQLLLVTNVTTNTIIYNFANSALGGSVSGNVLTLTYDTTTMNNGDSLQIFIDNNLIPASNESLQYLQDQTALLGRMVKLLEPSSRQNASGMQQIDIGLSTATVPINQGSTFNSPALGNTGFTIPTVESNFVLQSRIAYSALRNQLEFS
jgi:hypothetical protein